MSFSNYLEDAVLNHVFGGSAYSAPSTFTCPFPSSTWRRWHWWN